MLVLASQQQEQECGDGTNFVLVFAGALLDHAEQLLRMVCVLQCTCLTIFTLRTKLSCTLYCNRSCLWVCVFVGLLPL